MMFAHKAHHRASVPKATLAPRAHTPCPPSSHHRTEEDRALVAGQDVQQTPGLQAPNEDLERVQGTCDEMSARVSVCVSVCQCVSSV